MKNKIGTYLRQHREEKHLTLQQAAEQTGIREPYLAALEEGDFHKIPGDVFIRGFLRNYGNYLGLDGNGLVEAYRTGSEPEKILKPVEEPIPAPAPPKGDTLILRKPASKPEKKAAPEAKPAPAPEPGKQAEPFDKVTALKQMEPVGYGASHRNGREKAPETEKQAQTGKPDLEATRIMAPVKPSPADERAGRRPRSCKRSASMSIRLPGVSTVPGLCTRRTWRQINLVRMYVVIQCKLHIIYFSGWLSK